MKKLKSITFIKYYVYDVISYYDKEKKASRKKRKIVGQRCPETGEIIPNRPKAKKGEGKKHQADDTPLMNEIKTLERKHYGAVYFLNQAARKIGMVEDLKQIFPQDYGALLNMAYYLVLSPTNSMRQMEDWTALNYLPYAGAEKLNSQRIFDLFKRITEDDKQQFFNLWSQRIKKEEYWYYDTTSISSYSKTLSMVQWEYNKEDDKLPQLNLGIVYGEETKLPLMYRYLNGNTPDSKTITWLLSLVECLPIERIKFVMDRGFYSERNVYELIQNKVGFIMGTKRNLSYVKTAIDEVEEAIESFEHYSKTHRLYGQRVSVNYFKSNKSHGHYPMQLYIYFDKERAAQEQLSLDEHLSALHFELTHHALKTGNEKDYQKYFEVIDNGKQVKYQVRKDVVSKEKRRFGYFTILSSYKKDVWEVLNIYRNKELIEDNFHNLKDRTNMRRVRVSSEASLEGKIFVQFLAFILCAYIKRELEKTKLNETYTHDKLLSTLNRIDILSHKEYGATISEVTVAQKIIYAKCGLTPPD